MEKKKVNIEGIEFYVEYSNHDDKEAQRRYLAYCFQMVRKESGMSRKDFSEWLGIPYRTMQEWELGRRAMPDYVLNLIAYKVHNEMSKKEG
jgi:DNA-binding transcriptional regulator YiaG